MDFPSLKDMAIRRGSVFRMELFPQDGVTPKNEGDVSRHKYFVVLGVDSDKLLVGSLLINTEINTSMIRIIAPYQHCVYPERYAFLQGKFRYVDCYLIKEFSYDRVLKEAIYVGLIEDEDLEKIVELAQSSPANRPYVLRKYGID